jgi:hypothetical protein
MLCASAQHVSFCIRSTNTINAAEVRATEVALVLSVAYDNVCIVHASHRANLCNSHKSSYTHCSSAFTADENSFNAATAPTHLALVPLLLLPAHRQSDRGAHIALPPNSPHTFGLPRW